MFLWRYIEIRCGLGLRPLAWRRIHGERRIAGYVEILIRNEILVQITPCVDVGMEATVGVILIHVGCRMTNDWAFLYVRKANDWTVIATRYQMDYRHHLLKWMLQCSVVCDTSFWQDGRQFWFSSGNTRGQEIADPIILSRCSQLTVFPVPLIVDTRSRGSQWLLLTGIKHIGYRKLIFIILIYIAGHLPHIFRSAPWFGRSS